MITKEKILKKIQILKKKNNSKDSFEENKEMKIEDNHQEQIIEQSKEKTNKEYIKLIKTEESKQTMEHYDKLIRESLKKKSPTKPEKKIRASFGGKIQNLVEMYNNKNKEPVIKNNNPIILRKLSNIEKKEENKMDENYKRRMTFTEKKSNFKINDIIQKFEKPTNNCTKEKVNENNFGLSKKVKDFNKMIKVSEPVKEEIKPKIFPKSEILSKENPNMTIYKFPNIHFSDNENNNSKIIVFLGDAQEFYINSFINIYRNISFKDNFRYKIDSNDIRQNEMMIYDIKSYDIKKNYNIKIISIPFCKEKNENFIKNIVDILRKIPRCRINLICYTFDENINDLNINHLNEIRFYKYFLHLLNIRDKLLFLCSAGESLEKDEKKDYIINLFNFDKNDYLYEEKMFKDDFIFINNKCIYENDKNTDNNWKILIEKFQLIQNKIKENKAEKIERVTLDFFDDLLIDKIDEVKVKFVKLLHANKVELIEKYKEAFLFIYFLQIINFNKDRSNIILDLYNRLIKDIHSNKKIDTYDNELKFIDDKYGDKALNFISKLNFNKLESIHFQNCGLIGKDISLLKNLVTSNLEYLNLSKNQIQDINKFFEKDVFSNLKVLNLSNNNIVNISSLSKIKFNNLEKLFLNSNKIIDIECLLLNDNFDKLKLLDLSSNNIQKLQKINIKSLEELHLLNNEINSGINDFVANNNFSNKLDLDIQTDSVYFHFYNTLNIDFEYKIKNKKIEEFLNELNYNGIYYIQISGIGLNEKLKYNINDCKLKFNNNKNGNLIICIISKFPFNNNVSSIDFSNNELINKDILLMQNYFNPVLIDLDLSKNKINDINVFFEKDSLYNLINLNMSHNNITDISLLSKSKLNNLKVLNLSFNKISNIDFLQLNTNFDKLETIDLSNNLINKLTTINIKTLKELKLLKNEINSGIDTFIENINNLSDELLLENLENSIIFNYDGNLKVKFQYYFKDNNIQFLKSIKLNGIHILKIKNFDKNIEFLENESLKELQELDLTKSKIDNLSVFKKIHFINIKKMTFSDHPINDSLDNIKIFPSIIVKAFVINDTCVYVKFNNPEFGIIFSNYNILMDDLMDKTDEILIQGLPDNNLFSYNSFRDYTIPIFKCIKARTLSICFKDNKYSCNIYFNFKKPFSKTFIFDDLNFLKKDEILSEVEYITFSNIVFDDNINFETNVAFTNLKKLELNNCIIENIKIFEQIYNKIKNDNLIVISNSTKCNPNLQQYMDKDIFSMENNTIITKNELNYIKPFKFDIEIDLKKNYDMLKNLKFKNIEILNFSSAGLKNIDFLTNNSLINLNELLLSNNEIEDISILNIEKVHFHKLKVLNLKDNPIKIGIEVLKDKFFTKCSYVFIKLQVKEEKFKILTEFKNPNYDLDFYINDINDILNIFEKEKIFLN